MSKAPSVSLRRRRRLERKLYHIHSGRKPICKVCNASRAQTEPNLTAQESAEFFEANSYLPESRYSPKSVQIAFSTVNLKDPTKTHPNMFKESKYQVIVKKNNGEEEDLFKWLHEIHSMRKGKTWSDKLIRLAEKMKKPGGEEKLRYKIKKFLNRFPSNFEKDDEEGQRFREQLPDYIIMKLRKIISKQRKRYKMQEKYSTSKPNTNLKSIVKSWIKALPVTKKDFLGRPIKKEQILESMIQRIEPFVLHRPENARDFKNILTSYVTEIAKGIPLENDKNTEIEYINVIVHELVEKILGLGDDSKVQNPNVIKSGSVQNVNDQINTNVNVSELEKIVVDELEFLLKFSDITLSEKLAKVIEKEITCMFYNTLLPPAGVHNYDDLRSNIGSLLIEVGKLPEFQAKYFSQELVKTLKYVFLMKFNQSKKRFGYAYSEASLVYNMPQINLRQPHKQLYDVDSKLKVCIQVISSHIEQWLCSHRMHLPLIQHQTFRDVAVHELTQAIVNRLKYLESHPSDRGSHDEEHEHVKLLIFKWIRKLVGEDNLEIIQHVPELLNNVEKMTIPQYSTRENNNILESRTFENLEQQEIVKDLYEEILEWYSYLPRSFYRVNDRRVKRRNIKKLVDNVAKELNSSKCLEGVIDKEVDSWTKKVLKSLPRVSVINDLKARIKTVTLQCNQKTNKVPMQFYNNTNSIGTKANFSISVAKCVKIVDGFKEEVVNEISDWFSGLSVTICQHLAQEAIENLAADIVDRYKYLELNPGLRGTEKDELESLKYQIYKWLNRVVSENNMEPVTHAPELMQRLHSIIPRTEQQDYIVEETLIENFRKENNGDKKTILSRPASAKSKCDISSNIDVKQNPTINIVGTGDNKETTERQKEAKSVGTCIKNTTETSPKLATRAVGGEGRSFSERHGRLVYTRVENSSRIYGPTPLPSTASKSDMPCNGALNFQQANMKNWPSQMKFSYCYNNYPAITAKSVFKEPFKPISKKCQDTSIVTDNIISEVQNITIAKSSEPRVPVQTSSLWTLPKRMNLCEIYEHFDRIFKYRCGEIPFDESNPEINVLGKTAKQEIYNAIWKTYFRLKADPSIENNYVLFGAVLEDQLDILLDCLPLPSLSNQNENFKFRWKSNVIAEVIQMLGCVHSCTDALSFRQQLTEKFRQHFVQQYNKELTDRMQHLITANTVGTYILYTRYKINDPLTSNVYRQRLMKQLADLADNATSFTDIEISNLDKNRLIQEALNLLNSVDLPDEETLNAEASEILLMDEIERWYKHLDTTFRSEIDEFLRQRKREILAKRLFEIEQTHANDENKIKYETLRETIEFLKSDGFEPNPGLKEKAEDLLKRVNTSRKKALINLTFHKNVGKMDALASLSSHHLNEQPGPSNLTAKISPCSQEELNKNIQTVNSVTVSTSCLIHQNSLSESSSLRISPRLIAYNQEANVQTDNNGFNKENVTKYDNNHEAKVLTATAKSITDSVDGRLTSASVANSNIIPTFSLNSRNIDLIGVPLQPMPPRCEYEGAGFTTGSTPGLVIPSIGSRNSNGDHDCPYYENKDYRCYEARDPRAYWCPLPYPYSMPYMTPRFY